MAEDARAAFAQSVEVGHDLPDFFVRNVEGQKAFDEHVAARLLAKVVVHVVPEGALVVLQGDDVVHVGDGDAVVRIIPQNVRHEFAAFRGRMYGKFDEFHKKPLCAARTGRRAHA